MYGIKARAPGAAGGTGWPGSESSHRSWGSTTTPTHKNNPRAALLFLVYYCKQQLWEFKIVIAQRRRKGTQTPCPSHVRAEARLGSTYGKVPGKEGCRFVSQDVVQKTLAKSVQKRMRNGKKIVFELNPNTKLLCYRYREEQREHILW